jgi:hypothetical protein
MNKKIDMTLRFFITLSLVFVSTVNASNTPKKDKINYRTDFGKCPSKVVGSLTIKLIEEFEKNNSLKEIKELIIRDNLEEKHFLSSYKIKYDPITSYLNLSFECPEPLMKVQIYKDNGLNYYTAILVSNGQLFDPTYEVILENEKKLKYKLPSLALPVGKINFATQNRIAKIFKNLDSGLKKHLSEIIVDSDKKLTIILSYRNHPTSAFLGDNEWEEKLVKLQKLFLFMKSKRKLPTTVNMTNSKKVVVKFAKRI